MELVTSKSELRDRLGFCGRRGSVGLVPTMGNLHPGHLSLFRVAAKQCDRVVSTVFVNPTQFGPNEDFDRYPRSLARDREMLERAGVELLFAPATCEMYPGGQEDHAVVEVGSIGRVLCGATREGHFNGVATVVAKLFNLAQPQRSYFGQKDWQQLMIIRRMAAQLDMPVEIVGVPTVREPDGLAMSSRNCYLSVQERERAPALHRALVQAASEIALDRSRQDEAVAGARDQLLRASLSVEYIEVRDQISLRPASEADGPLRVFGAVQLGKTRLIDNVAVPS